jgi:hypothetical protein
MRRHRWRRRSCLLHLVLRQHRLLSPCRSCLILETCSVGAVFFQTGSALKRMVFTYVAARVCIHYYNIAHLPLFKNLPFSLRFRSRGARKAPHAASKVAFDHHSNSNICTQIQTFPAHVIDSPDKIPRLSSRPKAGLQYGTPAKKKCPSLV